MGFCSDAQYEDFLQNTPGFEAHLVNEGIAKITYCVCKNVFLSMKGAGDYSLIILFRDCYMF